MWQSSTMKIRELWVANLLSWKGFYVALALLTVCAYGTYQYQTAEESTQATNFYQPEFTPAMAVNSGAFIEQNGLVKFQMESNPLKNGWKQGTQGGITFYEATQNSLNNPNSGVINYDVQIKETGVYRIQWRSRINTGSNSTEHNDNWMKLPNNGNVVFFGYKGSGGEQQIINAVNSKNNVVFPKGSGLNPLPAGSGGSGYFKIYMNIPNAWVFQTRTSDFDPHNIYAWFKTAGTYTMQISNRSAGHAIDFVTVHKVGRYNENQLLNAPQSPRTGGGTPPPPPPPSNQSPNANAGPNQTKAVGNNGLATFNLNGGQSSDPDGSIVSYVWKQGNNTVGQGQQISLTRGVGNYTITLEVTDNQGAKDTDQVQLTATTGTVNPPPPSNQLSINQLVLVNASTNNDIKNIVNGDQFSTSDVGNSLSVKAVPNSKPGSVVFNLNGQNVQTENISPYALNGDANGNFIAANLPVGNYTLTATPFSGSNGTGQIGASKTVTFSIVSGVANPPPTPTPPPSSGSNTLNTVADAFLQGGAVNNGQIVRVENNNRVAYLKFDLSNVSGNITKAQLKVLVNSDPGNGNVIVSKGSSNNWTEGNLSNANKPNPTATLGGLNTNYNVGQSYTWNLDASQISGGGLLTLIMTQTSGNDFAFAARESNLQEAQLIIETNGGSTPPPPSGDPILTSYTLIEGNRQVAITEGKQITISGPVTIRANTINSDRVLTNIFENGNYIKTGVDDTAPYDVFVNFPLKTANYELRGEGYNNDVKGPKGIVKFSIVLSGAKSTEAEFSSSSSLENNGATEKLRIEKVFANPIPQDRVKLGFSAQPTGQLEYVLLDYFGRTITKGAVDATQFNNETVELIWEGTNLTPGTYFLQIKGDKLEETTIRLSKE